MINGHAEEFTLFPICPKLLRLKPLLLEPICAKMGDLRGKAMPICYLLYKIKMLSIIVILVSISLEGENRVIFDLILRDGGIRLSLLKRASAADQIGFRTLDRRAWIAFRSGTRKFFINSQGSRDSYHVTARNTHF